MSKCSILITCYNLGMYLEEALQSSLAQTHPDFEVIVVDDGSTDPDTIAVLDRLSREPRVRILRTVNQGVARARNYGISQASGEYILPLDADDRILPEYLERAAAILDAQPEVGFVGCHYKSFGERNNECRPAKYQLPDVLIENVVPIASLFRRTCWEQIGGYCPDLNSIEDWDLWIGILEAGWRGEVIPKILFEYRVRPNSNLSHLRKPETYVARLNLLYQRHARVYAEYLDEIMRGKDRQFAELHAWALYLEQQARNWEHVANERLEIINRLSVIEGQKQHWQVWAQRQVKRWQQIRAVHPSVGKQAFAILAGVKRVVLRKLSRHRFLP